MLKEQIKYDLTEYATKRNISINDAISELLSLASPNMFSDIQDCANVIKAWYVLQVLEPSTLIKISDDMRNNKTYDGVVKKFGANLNNKDYIIKFMEDVNDLSVICEYLASNFIRKLGINCHNVSLGYYKDNLVSVIEDFTSDNKCLHTFKNTKQSSEDTDLENKEYTYDDVTYLIEKHLKLSTANKNAMLFQFWNMYICDAILANRDRHWGNWGYLSDSFNNYTPAPIYDNGASLFPGVLSVISNMLDNRKHFMQERIFDFPASLFRIMKEDRSYRSNYYEIIGDTDFSEGLTKQLQIFREKFSYDTIYNSIKDLVISIPVHLSDNLKYFWIEIVTLRYMCIILRMDFDTAFEIIDRRLQNERRLCL